MEKINAAVFIEGGMMRIEIDDSEPFGDIFFQDLALYESLSLQLSEIIKRDGGFNDENSALLDSIYSQQKILMPQLAGYLVAKLRTERKRVKS